MKQAFNEMLGGKTRVPMRVKDVETAVSRMGNAAVLTAEAYAKLSQAADGSAVSLTVHPLPTPLEEIAANIEFEMIGAQDPKMPKGVVLLTGWERSNLGPTLQEHGAKIGPDPYPEQHFFERSDNYALALKGVVAHTAAGWGTPPYYHRADDDLAHLDFNFMTEVIQSFVAPIEWLANSNFKPQWNEGGQPKR